MPPSSQLVVFSLDERAYALRLARVNRIVPAVHVAPLPGAPAIVLGVINVAGEIVPVFDLRKRFELPPKPPALTDQIILARTERRQVALMVDRVTGVIEPAKQEVVEASQFLAGLPYVEGVVTLPGGLAVIHSLETFLGFQETTELEEALSAGVSRGHDE